MIGTVPADPPAQLLDLRLAGALRRRMDVQEVSVDQVAADTRLRRGLVYRALQPDRAGLSLHAASRLARWCGLRFELTALVEDGDR